MPQIPPLTFADKTTGQLLAATEFTELCDKVDLLIAEHNARVGAGTTAPAPTLSSTSFSPA